MKETWKDRTKLLIGNNAVEKLKKSKVAVYGIGGVGSFVVEGLIRAGIGNIVLIDNDVISITNLNRQIHATCKTINKRKIDVMKERILEINPEAKVDIYMANELVNEEDIMNTSFSYIVDAVDTITTKIKLVVKADELQIPIISCMGTGNKLNPTQLEVTDIYKTSVCPLAKVMRKELKKRNIKKLKVIYSREEPIKPNVEEKLDIRTVIPGSISFVPSVAGLIIASEVVKDLIKNI